MSQAAAIKKAHVAALQKKHGVNVRYGRAENGSSQASYQTTVPGNQRSSTIVHSGGNHGGALSSGGKHNGDNMLQNSVGISGEFNPSAMSNASDKQKKLVSASVDKKSADLDRSFQFGSSQMQNSSVKVAPKNPFG